jgi:hypothetical protein
MLGTPGSPRLRREHLSRHATGRPADLDLTGLARPPARPDSHRPPRCARRPVLVGIGTEPPTLADSGYESAGHGVYTPIKKPADGKTLAVDDRAYNLLLRSTRCHGERGFALLTQRWQTLQHTTASPSRIGDFVKAALVLTHFEHRYLPIPC